MIRILSNLGVNIINIICNVAKSEGIQFISHYHFIQNYLLYNNLTIEDLMIEENCKSDGLHPIDIIHKLIYRNLIESLNV